MTLTSRLTNWLIEHNHSVDILILAPKNDISSNVANLFSNKAALHFVEAAYRHMPWYPLNLKSWVNNTFVEIDVIVALSMESLYVSSALYHAFRSRPVIIPYVIDNVAYTRSKSGVIAGIIRRHFLYKIPDEFKMFMSQTVRDIHADSLKTNFDKSKILLIPTKLSDVRKCGMPQKKIIVSIGRVDNAMKKYVHQLPEITAKLRKNGYVVTCDIYGHGDSSAIEELHKHIRQYDVQESVNYHGEVEYTRFHDVLRDCFVFVGMGTSAIEASMFGVPTITAVAFCEKPISYGYLPELPLGALGEDLKNGNTREIESMIAALCEIPESEYINLSKRHVDCAKNYDEDVICVNFLDFLNERLNCPYREFKMPVLNVLAVNVVRGFNYLIRYCVR